MEYKLRRAIVAGAIVALAYAGITASTGEPRAESETLRYYMNHIQRHVLK